MPPGPRGQLPHASPFLFVDRVLERSPPDRCVTLKVFSAGEPLLEGAEVVPAALVMEALCQSAGFLPGEVAGPTGSLVRIEEAELLGEVRIGDRLIITTVLLEAGSTALSAESRGEVEGRPVARLRMLIGRNPAAS